MRLGPNPDWIRSVFYFDVADLSSSIRAAGSFSTTICIYFLTYNEFIVEGIPILAREGRLPETIQQAERGCGVRRGS